MAHIIISESQLHIIREFANNEVLHDEFETNIRNYMDELSKNPLNPKFDNFFTKHNIKQNDLQNKMLDLGLISKKENITEPEDANGKKRSMHSKRYTFYNRNFNQNIDKLYDTFFTNKGQRKSINEEDGGGALGGCTLNVGTTDASGGITYPLGGKSHLQRKAGYNDKKAKKGDITAQAPNVDMTPAFDRTPGKIAMNRKK